MSKIISSIVVSAAIQVTGSAQSVAPVPQTAAATFPPQPQIADNGKVRPQELSTLDGRKIAQEHERVRQIAAARLREFGLNYFDTNKDGKLDAREQRARARWCRKNVPNSLPQIDKNGNGIIEPEELNPRRPGQRRQ